MKRIWVVLVLLLAGLGVPYAASASRPPDTVRSYGWGSSYFGQLGVGLTGIAMSPVAVDTTAEFAQIVAGERHTCALDSDGHAWCWGLGASGQLGDGRGTDSGSPVPVDFPDGTDLTRIAVGAWGSCALDSNGYAYCWGIKYSLGDGSTTNALSPVKVDTSGVLSGRTLTDITMGSFTACALDTEGLAYCWGVNYGGQLGTGDTIDAPKPRAVDNSGVLSGAVLTDIDSGGGHTCVVDEKRHAFCWGDNYHGQLGDGTTTNALSAVQVDQSVAGELISITAGGSHTCALTVGHEAYCWGFGGYGQLGINSTTSRSTPGAVVGLPTGGVAEISAGSVHTCGLAVDGSALCWGDGTEGRVGNDSIAKTLVPDIVPVPDPPIHVAAGLNHSCMVDARGNAYCWGAGESGQLGDGRVFDTWSPVAVPGSATEVAAGGGHSCAILQDGSVVCAGNGDQGQLGMGSVGYRAAPVTVPLGGPATAIAAGEAHSCALVDGRAYCWGNGSYGQLGDPAKRSSLVPVPVSMTGVLAGKTLVSITAGDYHTCAIDTVGAAYCWGRNQEGQLGNGGGGSAYEPVAVSDPGKPLAGISAGAEHTCAVAADGTGFCWGNNEAGQLGTGDTVDSLVPVPITGGHHFAAVSAGRRATCGVADGVAVCWGNNGWAQLGTGDMSPRLVPTAVTGLAGLTVRMVSAGVSHACAATDQHFYCWGMNSHGEIGAVTGQYATSAVLVSGTTATPAALSCGQEFTLAATTQAPPLSAPDSPAGLSGSAADSQVQLTWTPPAWDGGSPITVYTVTGAPAGSCESTVPSCTIDGLANGVPHTFTVTATNVVGTSAASDPVVLTPVAAKPAISPVGKVKARVKVHKRKAVVRWTPAANATGYQVRIRRPGKKFTGWKTVHKRKYVVRHLKPGKRYVTRVRGVSPDDKGPVRQLRFRAKRR